jgi:PAS domain-containing protein
MPSDYRTLRKPAAPRTRPRIHSTSDNSRASFKKIQKTAGRKELEMILARQLADCLAMPIFLVDARGTLLFYNEPAELILGRRFEETGELTASQWAKAFVPTDEEGQPLPPKKLPLMIALRERRPAHSRFFIRGLDHSVRHIEATAFPLVGRTHRFLGAVAIFWEVPDL